MLELARDLTTYDAAYVRCAETLGGVLVTRDGGPASVAARSVAMRIV